MKTVLEIRNLSVSYGDHQVLDMLNLHLKHGEIVSILGESGVGKTTLFNAIAGLIPVEGEIMLEGQGVTGKTGSVSYMLQKDLLFPFKTIIDNVSLPLILKGYSKKKARQEASYHFKTFGLEGTEKKYPHQLSGGMRQRAALLRTYCAGKNVALLDEPFSALDTITRQNMHEWYLNIMNHIHLSTLFITHDIDEALMLSDRIYILKGKPGKIVQEITVDLPKPRQRETSVTAEFMEYKRMILETLQ